MNGDEAVRIEGMDPVHGHLRKLDQAVIDLNGRFDAQDEKLAFLVDINTNLKGLSEFVKRWGDRFSTAIGWLAKIGVPLLIGYETVKDQAWFKRWFG